MWSLAFKILFRRKGTASTILTIALLIALLASVNSLVNNISNQTNALSKLARIGDTYLIVSQDAPSLDASRVNANLPSSLASMDGLKYVLPQTLLTATVTSQSGNSSVTLRGVDNPKAFFNIKQVGVTGSVSINQSQVNVGIIFSKAASISVRESVWLSVGDRTLQVVVVGITEASSQEDTEIIVPMAVAHYLCAENAVSFIEFAPKDPAAADETINSITPLLSPTETIVKVQQVETFAQDINNQFVAFLNLWSFAIYTVVVAASYVVASRLITESKYELAMFRTIGAQKRATFQLVLFYTVAIAFLGSMLGLSIGIAGAQVASTAVRWVWGSMQLAPFLEAGQALQILLVALTASVAGCIYPALKSARNPSVETLL